MNVYEIVTAKILEQIEKGVCPWRQSWVDGEDLAISYESRKPYSLLNQILLGRSGEWLTFTQIKKLGGHIKKGAKSGMVVFYCTSDKRVVKNDSEDENEDTTRIVQLYSRPILKYYNVFHIDDVEGVESKSEKPTSNLQPVEAAEKVVADYIAREGVKVENSNLSGRAFYRLSTDTVTVPTLAQYKEVDEYYSTLFHELVHSTGRKSRCDREKFEEKVAFGSEDYSREELVAELGSAMLCAKMGFDSEACFKNSAAYLKGWASYLKEDTKAIVFAAIRAEKAVKYILNEQ